MKTMILLSIAVAILVVTTGCKSEPSGPSGTLPQVRNLQVVESVTKGDTVVLAWDPLDVEVTSYNVFYAKTDPGDWKKVGSTTDTTYTHFITTAGCYLLQAQNGDDYSSAYSNQADTWAFVSGDSSVSLTTGAGNNGMSFRKVGKDSVVCTIGNAEASDFAQDIYIDVTGGSVYMYSGNAHPESHPGGKNTKLSFRGCQDPIAPEPGSTAWVDSLEAPYNDYVFIKLDDNFVELYVREQSDGTVEILFWEYQLIDHLRIFNLL